MESKNNEFYNISLLNIIKNNYLIKEIFQFLTHKSFLNILKYNKNMQKRLDLNLNNYKIYYEEIEIAIIPLKEKKDENNTKFINILKNMNLIIMPSLMMIKII